MKTTTKKNKASPLEYAKHFDNLEKKSRNVREEKKRREKGKEKEKQIEATRAVLLPRSKLLGSLGWNKGYLGVLRGIHGYSALCIVQLYSGISYDIPGVFEIIQGYSCKWYGVNILGIGRRFPVVLPPIIYTSYCRAHQKLSIKGKILSSSIVKWGFCNRFYIGRFISSF